MHALRHFGLAHPLGHGASVRPRGVVYDVHRPRTGLHRQREVDHEIKIDDRPLLRLDLLPVGDDIRHGVRAMAVQPENRGVQVVQQEAVQGVAFM